MAEKAFFFNSLNGDRLYNADDFVAYFNNLVASGVFKDNAELNLKVQAYSGMTIRVNKGAAIINGYRYLNDSTLDLVVENSDATNDRIDLVVVRLDINNREVTTLIKKGIPGTIPVKPQLINTGTVVEISLASIRVARGSVTISNTNITDERIFSYSYLDVNHRHKLSEINDDVDNVTLKNYSYGDNFEISPTGKMEIWGITEVYLNNQTSKFVNIKLPKVYKDIEYVVNMDELDNSVANFGRFIFAAANKKTDGFELHVYYTGGVDRTGRVRVQWRAVGR